MRQQRPDPTGARWCSAFAHAPQARRQEATARILRPGLLVELGAQSVAPGDVHGLHPLESHQQLHSPLRVETLAPALGNDAALAFNMVLADRDVALGHRQTFHQHCPIIHVG